MSTDDRKRDTRFEPPKKKEKKTQNHKKYWKNRHNEYSFVVRSGGNTIDSLVTPKSQEIKNLET